MIFCIARDEGNVGRLIYDSHQENSNVKKQCGSVTKSIFDCLRFIMGIPIPIMVSSQWKEAQYTASVSGHYCDVIIDAVASQITSLTIVYSTVCSRADQIIHQSSASLAFVWGNHRWPVNSPHKGPVTRKIFPLDDVIMCNHEVETFSALLSLCEGN